MIAHEPLWDLEGRTLSPSSDVSLTIEALLRLQNAADHQRPISLYLNCVVSLHNSGGSA